MKSRSRINKDKHKDHYFNCNDEKQAAIRGPLEHLIELAGGLLDVRRILIHVLIQVGQQLLVEVQLIPDVLSNLAHVIHCPDELIHVVVLI